MGTTAAETEITPWTGKYAEYKLAGEIPEALKGKLIRTREAANLEEFRALVENGDEDNIRKLAQSAWDIIVQRVIRNKATSEEVEKLIAEGDVEGAVALCQEAADSYIYGARQASTGQNAVTKKKAALADAAIEAAKADPDLAAKLAALGFTL